MKFHDYKFSRDEIAENSGACLAKNLEKRITTAKA